MDWPPKYTWDQANLKKVRDEGLGQVVLRRRHLEEYEPHGCWRPPSLVGKSPRVEGRKGPRLLQGKTWQDHLGHLMTLRWWNWKQRHWQKVNYAFHL